MSFLYAFCFLFLRESSLPQSHIESPIVPSTNIRSFAFHIKMKDDIPGTDVCVWCEVEIEFHFLPYRHVLTRQSFPHFSSTHVQSYFLPCRSVSELPIWLDLCECLSIRFDHVLYTGLLTTSVRFLPSMF